MCVVLTADERRNAFRPAHVIIPRPLLDVTPRRAQLGNYSTPRISGSESTKNPQTKATLPKLSRTSQLATTYWYTLYL